MKADYSICKGMNGKGCSSKLVFLHDAVVKIKVVLVSSIDYCVEFNCVAIN